MKKFFKHNCFKKPKHPVGQTDTKIDVLTTVYCKVNYFYLIKVFIQFKGTNKKKKKCSSSIYLF